MSLSEFCKSFEFFAVLMVQGQLLSFSIKQQFQSLTQSPKNETNIELWLKRNEYNCMDKQL